MPGEGWLIISFLLLVESKDLERNNSKKKKTNNASPQRKRWRGSFLLLHQILILLGL
jgi:hypothetical protein